MKRSRKAVLAAIALGGALVSLAGATACDDNPRNFTVGSKKFTENVVLGEILTLVGSSAGAKAVHRRELGGTRVVFNALIAGDIDAYVEYTGTISAELLPSENLSASDVDGMRAALAKRGIRVLDPLGFNNTYALGMLEKRAAELGVTKTSDLVKYPALEFGFGNEFVERGDGWNALKAAYGLPQTNIRGMDHDIAYRAVADGTTDLLEAYTTDAQIEAHGLTLLDDDRKHFPSYRAMVLMREDTAKRLPEVATVLASLAGKIDVSTMREMNVKAQIEREPERVVAARFLRDTMKIEVSAEDSAGRGFWTHTRDHLTLVGISLFLALLVALPLGILAAKVRWLRQPVLGVVSILQTVPSLALLVFLIPVLGVGAAPAVVALFVYSLLPIVRNTVAGIDAVPPSLDESARALGLPANTRMFQIELPMALPSILAGVKTAAVINVGTATLGAIIGAGGYGQPILTGIRLDSTELILAGAIPAAILALLVSALFDGIERLVVSPGLRLSR